MTTLFLIIRISMGSIRLLWPIVIGVISVLKMIVLRLTMQDEEINEHINGRCRVVTLMVNLLIISVAYKYA